MEAQTKQRATRKKSKGQSTKRPEIKTARKVAVAPQIQILDIGLISPDPDQPRKTFDEQNLNQLAQSISEHGVLQPITVRKFEEGYTIVMGERRYRASKLVGKPTIPAMVREFADNDVLEVQIIENLQRKDVEPTEEAEAIQFLLDRYEPSEIAKRLGRSENYIRQRIKLASLIEGFKPFVRNGEMTLGLAVAVALFEPGEQQLILESLEGDFQPHRVKRMVDSRTFDLTRAPFALDDKTLVPKAGACTMCPFNAANQGNLFGEGKMVCTRTSCFENKRTKTFMKLLKRVKKEGLKLVPNISKYWLDEERNQWVMAQMEKEGLQVHLTNELEILKEPAEPTLENIKEEHRHYEYTKEELTEFLDEAKESFTEEKEAWDNAIEHGFEKGILLETDTYLTQTIFVKVREEVNQAGSGSKPLEKRKMAECTPAEQIIKINSRELRKKQIENNHLFKEVVDMIRETNYIEQKKALSKDEMVAICISLFENNIGFYAQREHFVGFLGDDTKLSYEDSVAQFKKDFKKESFYKLLRYLLTRQVHLGESNHTNDLTNQSFYVAMQSFYKDNISVIEETYNEKRKKREARIKERVAALEERAKLLEE
ncbi:parB-like partition protein [Allomuricauda ruestringensis DSM 13258]|uniref:ParB-like partition protein n=1 Tax=Allomuricauda ruestringensis (strain DSM 13258 / CIP 107369 / LMG 19739 / B1) TaxID=886377 RepID=G2PQ80_ALLRU|nr:ParB/RepB/Spo0J family partition protein [Allomuricauda ruestringensis]AEM71586.1 parB-like partition protein [Allomuricauda ruestringensis DSM 13258]